MSSVPQLTCQEAPCSSAPQPESPEVLRMSLAAAMTLDFAPGSFYRNACLGCINLLLTYRSGCAARCAYCGLSRRQSPKKEHMQELHPRHLARICPGRHY